MPKIDLPDGQWAQLRDDVSKAPRRLTKAVTAAMLELARVPSFAAMREAAQEAAEASPEQTRETAKTLSTRMDANDIPATMTTMEKVKEAKVLALVTAWSFDLPVSAEGLDEIPADAFDALSAEAEKRGGSVEDSLASFADPTQAGDASNG